jgi:hypothetical protein
VLALPTSCFFALEKHVLIQGSLLDLHKNVSLLNKDRFS